MEPSFLTTSKQTTTRMDISMLIDAQELEAIHRELEERLVRYAAIDTQADESSDTIPSTAKQFDLLRMLERELHDIGASDIRLTEQGFVLATIPATNGRSGPTLAYLAHVDTAPAYNATGVKPIVHRNYDGRPIVLPDALPGQEKPVIDPAQFPTLAQKVGHDIITASGLTLLGADDKAGVAIIMALAAYLIRHPEIPHGKIRLCFTPDEEIGTGIRSLKLEDLGADVAYTLDGGDVGELVAETFSADKAVITVDGISVHPGTAKNILVNALHLAAKIIEILPKQTLTPETTSGREGFIHVYALEGTAASAKISLILRDFSLEGLAQHGKLVQSICDTVQLTEPRARIQCTITPQYRNMGYWLEKDMRPVDLAAQAMRRAGLEPFQAVIRGGTDGSQLTERGLPTPNLFTGMQNVHGPLEWISVQDMAKSLEVCIHLAMLWGEQR
jgi:tripeptide aminopeptidase